MILKQKKGGAVIILGMILVLALSLFTFSKQQLVISMHDTMEAVMSMNPGFSSPRNLYDPGTGKFDQTIAQKVLGMAKALPQVVKFKLLNSPKPPPFERMDLDIKFINYKTLMDDRERAIKAGILSDPRTVKADIRFQGKTYKAKIRLKGDLGSHWTSRYRMSFRVNIRKGETLFGFKKFSLQKPRTRQHPYDPTFQTLMRKTGNLSSVHKYARVFVNGSDWGIMNLEEHMSKVFLEKLKMKESAIVRFKDERIWLYRRQVKNPYPWYRLSDEKLNIHLYGKKKYAGKDLFRKWITYLSEQRIKGPHPHLFDIESFARTLVLAKAWNRKHTLGFANSRYYFNPYTLRLEPITTDQLAYRVLEDETERPSHKLYKLHLNVMETDEYKKILPKVIADVSQVVRGVQDTLDEYRKFFPLDKRKDGQTVIDNMQKIKADPEKYLHIRGEDSKPKDEKIILPTDEQAALFDVHLYVRHYEDGTLHLFNLLPDEVRVKRVLMHGKPVIEESVSVPGYVGKTYEPFILKTPGMGIRDGQFTVESEYRGNLRTAVNGLTLLTKDLLNPFLVETPETLPFLKKVNEGNWMIPKGKWLVDGPLTVNGNLKIMPGTRLQFSENAYLILKGDLTAQSTSDKPIVFEPAETTWKGVYVLEGGGKSQLENVIFRKTSALKDGLLQLTGGVSFYKTQVAFSKVFFEGTEAEDALNLIKSSFTVKDSAVQRTVSDGIDFDFSNGSVTSSQFLDIGGDALDFSGSTVVLDKIMASRVQDKAVSVGEASSVDVTESDFSDIGVGIASKDGSHTKAENVRISRYGLHAAMTYIKKNFYGIPSLNMTRCAVDRGDAFSRQEGTRLLVDEVEVDAMRTDVNALYKGEIMKKKR